MICLQFNLQRPETEILPVVAVPVFVTGVAKPTVAVLAGAPRENPPLKNIT